MLESKGVKRIFSCGIDDLAITPNPRCDTHKGLCHLPCHIDNGCSLGVSVCHLRHGGAQTMNKVTKTSFGLPQFLGKLRRSPRSPRPSRCCQSPRVTSHSLHLSRIEHQERMHQLNLLASTWILMTWQVEWWWNMLLVTLKPQVCVCNVWRVERAELKPLGVLI